LTLVPSTTSSDLRAAAPRLAVTGRYQQGGFAFGVTSPRAELWLDGEAIGQASARGCFVIGFDRDAGPGADLRIATGEGSTSHRFEVARGDFDIQRIDGLPQDQVSPEDPALLKLIKAQSERKQAGLASRVDGDGFRSGFILPVRATRISGRFGGQRILNGEARRPHYGADLAAPRGARIVAPAAGTVCFAETGLHFEGGLVMIDHGQGLVSMYLHQSRVAVRAGQELGQGDLIGEVGATGRATGPHLCWRMKWRGRNLD
jgi:murein DD-endopeptidase MepM/ murein hydrolase activator NlpD